MLANHQPSVTRLMKRECTFFCQRVVAWPDSCTARFRTLTPTFGPHGVGLPHSKSRLRSSGGFMRVGRLILVVSTLVTILIFPLLLRDAVQALRLPSAYAAASLFDPGG